MMNDFLKYKSDTVEKNQFTLFDSEPGSIHYKSRILVNRLQEALAEFGLSSNQSKVYIFLGKSGPKTAPEVSKALQLPRTETYHLINTLQNRGIVTSEFCTPAKYSTLPIDQALTSIVNMEREKINSLSKQRKNIIDLWDEIPSFSLETSGEYKEKLQVLQGSHSINGKIKDMIRGSTTEFLMLGTEKDISRFYHADFFEILDTSSIKARFVICAAHNVPKYIVESNRSIIRMLKDTSSEDSCFIIKDRAEALLFTKNASYSTREITALWTNSKSLIDSMVLLFNCCWEKSEILYRHNNTSSA
jgi:HTH-type transcriptional regulator, sugar sensing transcriptional regulator